ncbi:MAG: DUF6713 family protein, partial [Salinisphaeraceae bacterium]|nr:DUF6713 family protein [Salinisphaeraceae bacterium]
MLNKLAILNIALLIGHQADAAYWHEWEMFAMPGGIQVFNIFNVVAFTILLGCLSLLVQRKPGGFAGSLVIIFGSGIVLPIHTGFALFGFEQFNLPVSIALIVGCFIVSLAQLVCTLRMPDAF